MSVKVQSYVWEHSKQKSSRLLLLIAIADNANDDGFAWPSQSTLAKKVRTTKRNVQLLCNQLEDAGELIIYNRVSESQDEQHFSNVYQIVLPGEHALPIDLRGIFKRHVGRGSVENFARGSEKSNTRVAKTTTSEPSIEPSEKDSSPDGGKPRSEWYDAIFEVWKYTGAINGAMQKMLQGTSNRAGWKETNLEIPLTSADALLRWARWYRATQLNGRSDLNMLEERLKIQSSIHYWQTVAGMPDAPAGAPRGAFETNGAVPADDFDTMLDFMGIN